MLKQLSAIEMELYDLASPVIACESPRRARRRRRPDARAQP
jgi:hypothetical protein